MKDLFLQECPSLARYSCKIISTGSGIFIKQLKSDYHKEAVEIYKLLKKTGDIGEKLSSGHKKIKN